MYKRQVLTVLLFLAFVGLALILFAAILGALVHRLIALDQVEVAQCELGGFGKGGLIVEQNGSLTRLSDNGSDPVLGLDRGADLVGFFETRSGRVYTVREVDAALYVQRDCADLECVAREAKKLPLGTQWSFTDNASVAGTGYRTRNVAWPATMYVRVYRVASTTTCGNFTITATRP